MTAHKLPTLRKDQPLPPTCGPREQHRAVACATQADVDAWCATLPKIAQREGYVVQTGHAPHIVVSATWGGPDVQRMQSVFKAHAWEACIPDAQYTRTEYVRAADLQPGDRLPTGGGGCSDVCAVVDAIDYAVRGKVRVGQVPLRVDTLHEAERFFATYSLKELVVRFVPRPSRTT